MINNDILLSNKEEENKLNQIINPFDSIISKKIKLKDLKLVIIFRILYLLILLIKIKIQIKIL